MATNEVDEWNDDWLCDVDVECAIARARARIDDATVVARTRSDGGGTSTTSLVGERAGTRTSDEWRGSRGRELERNGNSKQMSISDMFAARVGKGGTNVDLGGETRAERATEATMDDTRRKKRKVDGRKHQTTLVNECVIRSARDKRELEALATNLAPEALGERDAFGWTACASAGGGDGLPMDPEAIQTYVYPAQISRRDYQYDIARNALLTNSLVCLPTGLGKTLIAAVVMYNYYRWFPTGKIIFMAPTRPLVDQQMAACHTIVGIPACDTVVLMGSTKKDESGSRREFWREKRLFFCTPHTVSNDLENGVLDATQVVCVVVDEAHHARGDYASAQVVHKLNERNIKFRLLALTATPGQGIEEVQSVVDNLRIGRIDFRSDQDPDVSRYTHKREMQVECVKPGQAISHVQDMMCDLLRPMIRSLLSMGAIEAGYLMKSFAENKATSGATRNEPPGWYALQSAQSSIQRGETNVRSKGAALGILNQAMEISKSYELLLKYGSNQAYDYLKSRAQVHSNSLMLSKNQVAIEMVDIMRSMSANGAHHSPKLDVLTSIIKNHFKHATADTRVIVFTSYRESVKDIVRALREVPAGLENACKIKVAEFIGQGDSAAGKKRAGGDGRTTKGQTQKEQKQTLDDFRGGTLNTLVATSIGEEGLDIPSVDLIFFYDVVDIIRAIQRMGRTGRARDGKVVILATEGKEYAKFVGEQKKYENLMRCLRVAENYFNLEKNCPRIIPVGVTPVCQLRMIEASPAVKAGAAKTAGAGKSRKLPGPKAILNAAIKLKETPLDQATRTILFAYNYPRGALAELDITLTVPFLSRPDPVYSVEHGAWSTALVSVMADLQGIPRVDPAGRALPNGACSEARAKLAKANQPEVILESEIDDLVVPDSQDPPREEIAAAIALHDDGVPLAMEDFLWANDSQERPVYEAEIKTSQEVLDEFTQMSDAKPRRISMHSLSPSVRAASQARMEAAMLMSSSPNVLEASAARMQQGADLGDDESDSDEQDLFLSKRKRIAARALKKITNTSSVKLNLVENDMKRSQERMSMPPPPPRQTPQSGDKSQPTPVSGGSDDLQIKRHKSRSNARVLMSQFSPAIHKPHDNPREELQADVEVVEIDNERPRRRARAAPTFVPRRSCFIDDEAEASDDDSGDDDEQMSSGDERFIADSQEEDVVEEHPGMVFRHAAVTPGSDGGEHLNLTTALAALGPRERRVVQDTPSPAQRWSESASKYDSSFIDDGSMADEVEESVKRQRKRDVGDDAVPEKAGIVDAAPEKAGIVDDIDWVEDDGIDDNWEDEWFDAAADGGAKGEDDDDDDGWGNESQPLVHEEDDDGWGGESQRANNDDDDDDDDGW